ncbi:hypothetical protein BALOs_1412 [Halobacteriovorax sp. BALOs_7]|nr:hypothetical protein BALOs_1412 [Halobacteriovorax sp. BALOs_7]
MEIQNGLKDIWTFLTKISPNKKGLFKKRGLPMASVEGFLAIYLIIERTILAD